MTGNYFIQKLSRGSCWSRHLERTDFKVNHHVSPLVYENIWEDRQQSGSRELNVGYIKI